MYIMKNLGREYSPEVALSYFERAFGLIDMSFLFGEKKKEESWTCPQLVYDTLMELGILIPGTWKRGMCFPSDFATSLEDVLSFDYCFSSLESCK